MMASTQELGRVYMESSPGWNTYSGLGLIAVAALAWNEGAKAAHMADQYSGNLISNPYGCAVESVDEPTLPTKPGYYVSRSREKVVELLNSPREWINPNSSTYLSLPEVWALGKLTLLSPVEDESR